MVKRLLFSIFLLFSLFASVFANNMNILVIHGYDSFSDWSRSFNDGLDLAKEGYKDTCNISYYAEYMDNAKIRYDGDWDCFAEYLEKNIKAFVFKEY